MKKIAILGSENSHCWLFASVLSPLKGDKRYPDIELVGIYGENGEAGVDISMEEIPKMSSCTNFTHDKDAFLEDVDAVMITARDGAKHLELAESYIKKGIPVWIDKPITRSTEDVLKLVKMAKEYGAVLSGGSSLEFDKHVLDFARFIKSAENIQGGHITAPANMDNPYGGFWFYTQHLVAMITTVFGIEMKSVRAINNGSSVNAIYDYGDFSVTAYYGSGYSITVYTGINQVKSEVFELPYEFFMPELDTFVEVIRTGKADKSTKDYVAPVYILEATVKAFETGEKIDILIPEI